MKTTGTAMGLAKRVEAMRAELSETRRRADAGEPGMATAARALKRDLLEQECKLAEVGR